MALSISASLPPDYVLDGHQGDMPRHQSVADAAYTLAHGYPGGVPALAVRMGINEGTLKHKVNPNNDTHHLTLREAVTMQVMCNDAAILHAMAAELGYTCIPATPDLSLGDPVKSMAGLQQHQADLMRAMADALHHDSDVTTNEARRVDHCAQEAIAATGHAAALIRSRVRKAPKVG